MTHSLSRRSILAVPLLAMAGAAAAQEAAATRSRRGAGPAERIEHPRASHFDIGPADAPWRVFLGLPDVPAPASGYSALVALDGNATFPTLWRLRERMAPEAPVVLVGIGYPVDERFDMTRRWFDLTSPGKRAVPAEPGMRGPGDRPTGGQGAFLDMIATGILPELGRRLPFDRDDTTLFGHSLGGLFVLNALLTRPRLFARYAAADPSTWWNAGEVLREAAAFRGGVLAAGGHLAPAVPLLIASSGARRGAGEGASPAASAAPPAIVEALSGLPGLELVYRPHPGESHGSLIGPAAAEALDLHLGRLVG